MTTVCGSCLNLIRKCETAELMVAAANSRLRALAETTIASDHERARIAAEEARPESRIALLELHQHLRTQH